MKSHSARSLAGLVLLALGYCPALPAADLVLVTGEDEPMSKWQVEVASRFYGIRVKHIPLGGAATAGEIFEAVKHQSTVGVIVYAKTLPFLRKAELLAAINSVPGRRVPLLVFDVSPDIDTSVLRQWSGDAIWSCDSLSFDAHAAHSATFGDESISQEMAGQTIPSISEKECYFLLDEAQHAGPVMVLHGEKDLLPIFVRTTDDRQQFFFHAATKVESSLTLYNSRNLTAVFSELAPVLMFVRYAAGKKAWHSVRSYANLTIDDPWLTEPYGHLSYVGLLGEMEKYDYHTTIGFIPWNFDRNQSDIISLFRQHPDRFSIAIHGNNHDQQEFPEYEKKELSLQGRNIGQAIARMERFSRLTQLSYDRVMIFPHGIAPKETLAYLKQYNFLATINSVNLPLGSERTRDPLLTLRAVTLAFEGLASLRRYSVDEGVRRYQIAISLFLNNPLLLYAHHGFFANGPGSFNAIAKAATEIDPDTVWTSLGEIVRHLYLQRLRDDDHYELQAFSSDVCVDNVHNRDVLFLIRKEEQAWPRIKRVTVDGRPHSYTRSGDALMLEVFVPSRASRHVVIEYDNEANFSSVDVSKNSFRISVIRRLSDFRDLTLSRNVLGQRFLRAYYAEGELNLVLMIGLVSGLAFLVGYYWFLRNKPRGRKSAPDR